MVWSHIVGTFEWSKSKDRKAVVGKKGVGGEKNFLATMPFLPRRLHDYTSLSQREKDLKNTVYLL